MAMRKLSFASVLMIVFFFLDRRPSSSSTAYGWMRMHIYFPVFTLEACHNECSLIRSCSNIIKALTNIKTFLLISLRCLGVSGV